MSILQGHDITSKHKYAITQFSYEEVLGFWPSMLAEMNTIRHLWKYWDEDYILTSIANNSLTVWGCGSPPNAEFVFFLQAFTYPLARVLTIPLAFGRFPDDMLALVDATIENYARLQGCSEIEIRGRRGWAKKLKDVGYTHKFEIWSKPVADMRRN